MTKQHINSELDRFSSLVDRVLSVPKTEILRREKENQIQAALNPNKRGSKRKVVKPPGALGPSYLGTRETTNLMRANSERLPHRRWCASAVCLDGQSCRLFPHFMHNDPQKSSHKSSRYALFVPPFSQQRPKRPVTHYSAPFVLDLSQG